MLDFKNAAAAAGVRLSRCFTAFLGRRAIVPLLYANDRMLRDIGLSRGDVIDSLSGSFCVDPSRLLMARINERRGNTKPAYLNRQAATPANNAKPRTAPPKQPLAA